MNWSEHDSNADIWYKTKKIAVLWKVSVIVLKSYGFKTSNLSITIGTSPETYAFRGVVATEERH